MGNYPLEGHFHSSPAIDNEGNMYLGSTNGKLYRFEEGKLIPNMTEIQNEIHTDEITLYPNPAQEEINIKLNNQIQSHVRIINTMGKLMYEGEIQGNSKINTSHFSSGIYIVEINSNEKITYHYIDKN